MNRVQKRKFTLALNGLLRSRWYWYMASKSGWKCWKGRAKSMFKISEDKKGHLYEVVDKLIAPPKKKKQRPLRSPDAKASLADHQQ